jgi:hypothetical protein
VLLSSYITHKLDTKYELAGASPQAREMLAEVTVLRDQVRENR